MVFNSMEKVVRKHLNPKLSTLGVVENTQAKCLAEILTCEDVQFHWSLISVNWGEEESQELLKMIADHWITIRGFSFASAFIELYKQQKKITVQKSKSIGKKLSTCRNGNTARGTMGRIMELHECFHSVIIKFQSVHIIIIIYSSVKMMRQN